MSGGRWVWQEGRDIAWWLGAIVEAQSAADAAQRVASVVAARTGGVHTLAMTLHVAASTAHSTGELVAEEDVALHAIPGSAAPYIVPIRARAYARSGGRLTVEWTTSGAYELAHVTVAVTDFLIIGLFEQRTEHQDHAGHRERLDVVVVDRLGEGSGGTHVRRPHLDADPPTRRFSHTHEPNGETRPAAAAASTQKRRDDASGAAAAAVSKAGAERAARAYTEARAGVGRA